VWLRYKGKPGRRVVVIGPTLIGREAARRDLENMRERSQTDPADVSPDEVAEHAARLARLDNEWVVVDGQPPGQTADFPNVYTAADVIDRAEAERMLRTLLATTGVTQCRFVWKRMGFIVTPVML